MTYYLTCLLIFMFAFTVNMTYITVFYHRALTHRAVTLKPWMRRFVAKTGVWVTGLDPKTWCCMHRLHHRHSDTVDDPHSPAFFGIFGVLWAQLRYYEKTHIGLVNGDPKYAAIVTDLDFPISWVVKHNHLWLVPYLLQASLALGFGLVSGAWLIAAAFWIGMMSHPIQGWMVNSLAHRFGYRNFATQDNSRNNTLVSWTVMGEGFQNNHHRYPRSAKFSYRWWEVDLGYGLCLFVEFFGLASIHRQTLIRRLPQRPSSLEVKAA